MMLPIKQLLGLKTLGFIAVGYSVFITVLMLLPVSTEKTLHIPFFDKIIHALIYIVFVLVWYSLFRKFKSKMRGIYIIIPLVLFIYGIVIEVLQGSFVASRSQDIWDIVANGTGIIIGIVLFYKLNIIFLFKK